MKSFKVRLKLRPVEQQNLSCQQKLFKSLFLKNIPHSKKEMEAKYRIQLE